MLYEVAKFLLSTLISVMNWLIAMSIQIHTVLFNS